MIRLLAFIVITAAVLAAAWFLWPTSRDDALTVLFLGGTFLVGPALWAVLSHDE